MNAKELQEKIEETKVYYQNDRDILLMEYLFVTGRGVPYWLKRKHFHHYQKLKRIELQYVLGQ